MDDLKHKFLVFINKQSPQSKSAPTSPVTEVLEERVSATEIEHHLERRAYQQEGEGQEQVLESIEQIYFSQEEFDPGKYALKKLSENLEASAIKKDHDRLFQQHSIVSNKVFTHILQQQSACNQQFEGILEIQNQLQSTLRICREGRAQLHLATKQLTTSSLGILANYSKRQVLLGLLNSLNSIRTLPPTQEMSTHQRRTFDYHTNHQFAENWGDDCEERKPKSRLTKRSQNFKKDQQQKKELPPQEMSTRQRRAFDYHTNRQFAENWTDDWEERKPKPRLTKRSQNFKKYQQQKKELPSKRPEDAIKPRVSETTLSDEIMYDIGAVSASSFVVSIFDYNIDLANMPMIIEAIYTDLVASDARIARSFPRCLFYHYCTIITNVALLDSQYDRGQIVDDLQTRPSSILPSEYAVPKILHDVLKRLTTTMRHTTDKLMLNVPVVAYPQGPIQIENDDGDIDIPSGSFGVIDVQNHNVYECYIAPLVTARYIQATLNRDVGWQPLPDKLIPDGLIPTPNLLGFYPIEHLHQESQTIVQNCIPFENNATFAGRLCFNANLFAHINSQLLNLSEEIKIVKIEGSVLQKQQSQVNLIFNEYQQYLPVTQRLVNYQPTLLAEGAFSSAQAHEALIFGLRRRRTEVAPGSCLSTMDGDEPPNWAETRNHNFNGLGIFAGRSRYNIYINEALSHVPGSDAQVPTMIANVLLQNRKIKMRTEERLQELLIEGELEGAITLLLECQRATSTYRHFSCVSALASKLQDTLVLAEEQMDHALAKFCSCRTFDGIHYGKVQGAYALLGKTRAAMDQLLMHFSSAVLNGSLATVLGYVELCAPLQSSQDSQQPYNKMQYKILCKYVTKESFIPCLLDLCKSLWFIMKNYYQVMRWHHRNKIIKTANDETSVDLESSINQPYVEQKLEYGLARIWQDVQSRISSFLMGSDLSGYKLDEFLQVLGIVHRLMEVGEEFCGSLSEDLQDSIKQQSIHYFAAYHRERLEEMRIFLENEGWELCPVKPTFSILQLQEFRPLRKVMRSLKTRSVPATHVNGSSTNPSSPDCGGSATSSVTSGGFFTTCAQSSLSEDVLTPFDSALEDTTTEEDILANMEDQIAYLSDESDEDIPEELKRDFVDENAESLQQKQGGSNCRTRPPCPVVSNTSLALLRLCGRYVEMGSLLTPICSQVLAAIGQLLDLNLATVHSFFATDYSLPYHSFYSVKLQATLERIQNTLFEREISSNDPTNQSRNKLIMPQVSPCVNLNSTEYLYGLSERLVAVESAVFVASEFRSLKPCLEYLTGKGSNSTALLDQLFSQTIDIADELRKPVYMAAVARSLDSRGIIVAMSKVNWEVKDVMSQHSTYVDQLVFELQIFIKRLDKVAVKVPVSKDVKMVLWQNILHLTFHIFVEGFSNAKKCSNGGRALMQLDFTQFLSQVQHLSGIRPIPGREFVEQYVKAYYLPESHFENWIKEHSEYSKKQLIALVSCACQNNKKTKQRLITMIEDLDRGLR